jgi:hypothetical protein
MKGKETLAEHTIRLLDAQHRGTITFLYLTWQYVYQSRTDIHGDDHYELLLHQYSPTHNS